MRLGESREGEGLLWSASDDVSGTQPKVLEGDSTAEENLPLEA